MLNMEDLKMRSLVNSINLDSNSNFVTNLKVNQECPVGHNLKVNQECPCPTRLQEETLKDRLILDLDEAFTETSDGCSLPSIGSSGMFMSSQTPGRDLEDSLIFDMVPDVRS